MKNVVVGIFIGILICIAGRISSLVLFDWSYPTLGMLEEVYCASSGSVIDLRPLNKKLKTILEKHKERNPKYDVDAFAYVYMHYDVSRPEYANPVYILIYDISISKVWDQHIRAELWNEIKDEINSTIEAYFEEASGGKRQEDSIVSCPKVLRQRFPSTTCFMKGIDCPGDKTCEECCCEYKVKGL